VIGVDIWNDTVSLRGADGERRTIALEELKQEVGRPGRKPERPGPAAGDAGPGGSTGGKDAH
jgi:hypothetical protein